MKQPKIPSNLHDETLGLLIGGGLLALAFAAFLGLYVRSCNGAVRDYQGRPEVRYTP